MPHYAVNPHDSAMFSDGHSIGPHHRACWASETERVQKQRGLVLSLVFEVEASIDYAIADCVLPYRRSFRSPAWLGERHLLLQNEILTRFDFRTKIEIAGSLLSKRFPKKTKRVKELVAFLEAIRDTRNKMAHAPVYFEALARKKNGRWLRPHLMTSRGMIHLSDGYVAAFKKNSVQACSLLRQLLRSGLRIRRHEIPPIA
jgi:hypothetical protein